MTSFKTTEYNSHKPLEKTLSWKAPEHPVKDRDANWFVTVGVIAFSIALSAIIYGNILFAIFIVIAIFTLILFVIKKPRIITFTLTPKALLVDEEKYFYSSLESFWILYKNEGATKLIIQSKKLLVPHLTILIEEIDPEDVQKYLLQHLPEEEVYEPLTQQIMDYLGF